MRNAALSFLAALSLAAGLVAGPAQADSSDGSAARLTTPLPGGPMPPPMPQPKPATRGPLIAGEEAYVAGTHVWTDYAYDDRGADTDDVPGGDDAYPAAPHPGNTADFIQLQVGTGNKGRLRITAVLETLVPGHDALVGVAFNTDGDSSTGVPSPDLIDWLSPLEGLDLMVTLGSNGRGQVLRGTAAGWTPVKSIKTRVDRERNTLSAEVRSIRPGRATWKAMGVVGRVENGQNWFTSDLPIQDLAYVRGEDPPDQVLLSVPASLPPDALQPFGDHIQADVLAGDEPASLAVEEIRFGTKRTVLTTPRQGYNAFLYRSEVATPEGIARDPERVFNGVYQPYGVWIPAGLPKRPPMVMFLHGADQYHTVNVAYFSNPESIGIPSPYDIPAITIFPNGRTTNWGTPLADRDALDAMEDAVHRLRINRKRIVVSGVSSGGYGTYHLASRYPDLFTGAYSLVGGTGLGGGAVAAVENLTNLPFRASNGLADPLVNVNVWRASADALEAAKTVDYRIVLVHNRSHDGPLAEGNCYLLDLLSRDVVRRPGLIRFTVPAQTPEALALGLQPRRAYWVRDVALRQGGRPGAVRAESFALPGRRVTEDAISEFGENATHGADFCGANEAMQNGNNWEIEGRSTTAGPVRDANRLMVDLTNVRWLEVDLRQAGLDLDRSIRITVAADADARIGLPSLGRVIKVEKGTHTYRVGSR